MHSDVETAQTLRFFGTNFPKAQKENPNNFSSDEAKAKPYTAVIYSNTNE